MTDTTKTTTDRRGFLKTSAVLGAGSAAALLLPSTAEAATDQTDTATAKKPQQGYQETAHVRDYYASARV